MRVLKSAWMWPFVFAALIAFSQAQINKTFQWRYPAPNALMATNDFASDLGALFLGAHRLAADIAYIQFLQYYGVPEEEHDHEGHAHEPGEFHDEYGEGNYPFLKEKTTRYLRLDPFFNTAILEAAGALAFNVKRPEEALDYLKEAIAYDPTFYRYHLYMTAVLYKNAGDDQKLIEKLQEAMQYPDCPPLLQGVLGNLMKKYGRYGEAAKIYLHTFNTVASESDRNVARLRLERLIKEHPEVVPEIAPLLPR